MSSKITIHDVARLSGVSIKTVSRVLNREPNVKADTRDRVQAAVATLNYRPNISARSLAGSKAYLIGVFFDNPSPGYITDVQLGAIARCREEGYHLIVEPLDSTADDVEAQVAPMLANLRMDGVILTAPVCDNAIVMDALEREDIPFVRISPGSDLDRSARVGMDDRLAAYEMTRHLIDLGHKDIGFILGHPDHGATHLRRQGFVDAMGDAGLPVRPERMEQGYFSFRSGFEAAERLLSDEDRPTAVFASNDDMALGVMAVANRLRLNVPETLSVAGFDDTPGAKVTWPQLTTVRQPIAAMAGAAADMLLTGVTWDEGARPPSRLLDFELVVRESTGPSPRLGLTNG
ncbi:MULTISPECIES: LacI family DNA-binding transcriptional regulator [unclassified Caulobacter]|uniref:LacI family DNA-binding transcriptional regulator n=1 Tax=unclassified Caulobacter TaxID=2648921 RepID=UPI000D39CF00|nr:MULTISPECIES: LacI family DNA-binding transcriptional regulator [unclassified Caulobacter]PTS89750.1 transcriptional regulator [Caulobacter sp. HMWF009]PTT05073.1 transcriptional regulator [Caulobacter sp. HMWF025]